jgi:response regulator RpfG family c-di-GMP phosphodiesterase
MRKVDPQELQFLSLLLKENIITKSVYDGAIYKFEAYGGYIDEIVIDLGGIEEKTLLSAVAASYETKFVTMDKMKEASFEARLLETIPLKTAKQYLVFPIALDEKTKTLTVVTPRINDINAITEIERIAGVRKVRTYVARSETVNLAIRKWYERDTSAFQKVQDTGIQQYHQMMDVYEQNVLEAERRSAPFVQAGPSRQVFDEQHFGGRPSRPPLAAQPRLFSAEDFLATLQIMLGLIERERGDLKGHSVHVSRCIRQIGDRIRLPQQETCAYAIAGVLHDMGKGGMFHLTTLNVSLYEGHKDAALKKYMLPSKMFEDVSLPEQTKLALDGMYERYDGEGLPSSKKGKDISLGARILAVADSFSDLVMNPRNPYRKILSDEEAILGIEKYKDTIFDPVIVDALKANVAGGKLRTSILSGQNSILIVDGDTELGTILDLNLANRGFNVEVCNNAKSALERLQSKKFDLIVTELNLEPFDGFELIKTIKEAGGAPNIPVMFYTTRSSTSDVDKGFSLGAADYVIKPTSMELLTAKIMKITREAAEKAAATAEGGVSGSLREMDLPDLIQILSQGRKTGNLKISSGNRNGEIHFAGGQIVNALFGDEEGERAFYALLGLSDGFFSIDPKFVPQKATISLGTEALLLEGMRFLDESQK